MFTAIAIIIAVLALVEKSAHLLLRADIRNDEWYQELYTK